MAALSWTSTGAAPPGSRTTRGATPAAPPCSPLNSTRYSPGSNDGVTGMVVVVGQVSWISRVGPLGRACRCGDTSTGEEVHTSRARVPPYQPTRNTRTTARPRGPLRCRSTRCPQTAVDSPR